MTWFYVDGGQQAGPVDDEQLGALASSGKILPDTLVWCEGMAGWAAYREAVPGQGVPPLAPEIEIGVPPEPSPAAAGGLICCECGRAFAADQVIRYGERWVCAACKPIFLQRLREGATLAGAGLQRMVTEADLLARDYDVDIGGCLSQAWDLFKINAGLLIGASVLGYLAMFAVSFVAGVVLAALRVRYMGFIVVLFTAPITGGLWLFYIKKVRNLDAGVGDVFSGFGAKYGRLVLTALIPSVLGFAFSSLSRTFAWGAVPASVLGSRGRGTGSALAPETLLPLGILTMVIGLALIYLGICWKFALPLVADKGLKFWPAMQLSRRVVNKHWWMTFLLVFVCVLLSISGLIAFCLGVLVTAPVGFAALNYHYEKVFGDLTPAPG